MFKILVSIALALGIASVAYGAAATLDVDGGVFQYGTDEDVVCDDDGGVQFHYTTVSATDDTIDSAKLLNVHPDCNGHSVRIGFTDESHAQIAEIPLTVMTVVGGQVDLTTNLPAGLQVADIYDIHITFSN